MKNFFLSLFVLAITLPALAQSEAKYRKIDSLMVYFNRNDKIMGALTIREKGKVVFEKAYDFADINAKAKATPDTKYKIGAVTEIFTAAIIFQLIEEKKLTLDTKLSEFFPKIKNAEIITIADMLGHKSGIYNYTDDPAFKEAQTKLQNRKQMLDRIMAKEPAFEPGTKAEVSNSNYLLLGYIIQDITKKTYKENVTARVIKKAGLKNTYYFTKINSRKNEAYSYAYADGQWDKQDEWHESAIGGSGGLQSTASDLTLFAKALFDGKIITKASLNEMTKMDMGIGRGVFHFSFAERKFVGHNGNLEGFSTVLGYNPKEDLAISLTLNGVNTDVNALVMGILSCYYKLPYRFPDFTSVAVDDSVLKRYEGIYTAPSLPYKVKIIAREGKLVAIALEPGQGSFELNPLSENEFNFDPADLRMIFSEKGFTLKQGGKVTEFTKEK
ncbi:D-alanyl-D-alanine carboxypeptidase [Flavobacterium album]|uniref:D-alanyl-D-alanine carboxypeptidase n=1 Tax=Flavobacterium album TaxID=2175091 RepID=A0A2S1QUD4_9FLAO|nr:serine hydrolase domain-containing protein [Flavobacterium album]AWH83995.1 D-alanyl-D-alanine carboxypeptidase [Flavobacterium album]